MLPFQVQVHILPLLLAFWSAEAASRVRQSSTTRTATASYVAVTDANIFGGAPIEIMLPAAVTDDAQLQRGSSGPPLDILFEDSIRRSLPSLLKQVNLTHSVNVEDTAAFITQGLFSALGGNFSGSDSHLSARDLQGRCWPHWLCEVTEDVLCSLFAAGALPGYLVTVDLFSTINVFTPPTPSSYSEEFYFRPQYGDLSRSQGISFYRDAVFPPVGFDTTIAITLGRNIYVRPGYGQAIWAPHSLSAPYQKEFNAHVRLLLHEMKHIQQESDSSFNTAAFGLRYLFEFCKAGFSYDGNRFEQEAVAMEHTDDHLLSGYPNFQGFWRDTKLYEQLGYPTTVNTGRGSNYDTLAFEYGSVEIHDNENCWRWYTTAELAAVTVTGPKPWVQREPTGPTC